MKCRVCQGDYYIKAEYDSGLCLSCGVKEREMKVSMNGRYTTRDGREVRIYAVENNSQVFCVHGAIPIKGEWLSFTWDIKGMHEHAISRGNFDLIEKPKTVEVDFWVNVYGNYESVFTHPSRIAAEKNASLNRTACINIKRTIMEGEGL